MRLGEKSSGSVSATQESCEGDEGEGTEDDELCCVDLGAVLSRSQLDDYERKVLAYRRVPSSLTVLKVTWHPRATCEDQNRFQRYENGLKYLIPHFFFI